MAGINTARFALGVLIAGIVYFLADGTIHGAILASDHEAAIRGAGKLVDEDPMSFAYYAFYDLGKGFVAMFLYVMARTRLEPGAMTAIIAGLVTWFAVDALPLIASMPMPFYPDSVQWKWLGLEIVPAVVGAILGAWPYKEP